MCLSPTLIRNPNYGRKDKMSYLVDTKSTLLKVPCGHCKECVSLRQMYIVQRLLAESLTHHLFFCTLTYNNESMPCMGLSNGRSIRYAASRDVTLMMKRIRKYNRFGRNFSYFAVRELGTTRGRPHHHVLFLVDKLPSDDFVVIQALEKTMFDAVLLEWRRNYGSTRKPDYRPLCTYVRRFIRGELKSNFDLHYVNGANSLHGESDVAFYVTKYMMKPSDRAIRLQQALKLNLDEFEYERVWPYVRPGFVASPNLGLSDDVIKKYLRDCIDRSKCTSERALFYNPVSGQSMPLAPYYRRKNTYTIDDENHFYVKSGKSPFDSDNLVVDERANDKLVRELDKLPNLQRVIDDNDISYIFNELSDE